MPKLAIACLLFVVGCGARTGLATSARDGAASVDGGRDGGHDAGTDTGVDAGPPECVQDFDCDDGATCTDDRCAGTRCIFTPHAERCDDAQFCNGVETCTPFAGCGSGAPVVCGDAVACTIDLCDETLDACVFDPDVTACPVSHRCDPTRGCVARALAHDRLGVLLEIDLPDGAAHVIGALPMALTDIALAADGTLYGAIPGRLDRVDYVAGTSTPIVDVPGRFVALDVAPDGQFYGAANQFVYRIDVTTGTRTEVARFPTGYESSGDVAFVDGALLATANRDGGSTMMLDVLVRIPLDGTRAEILGSLGQPCVWGLAPFGSLLYGLTCRGDLLAIDPETGTSTVLAHPGSEFYGAAAR